MGIQAAAADEERRLESLLGLDADGYELLQDGSALVHGPFTSLEALQDGLHQQGPCGSDAGLQY